MLNIQAEKPLLGINSEADGGFIEWGLRKNVSAGVRRIQKDAGFRKDLKVQNSKSARCVLSCDRLTQKYLILITGALE